MDFWNRYATNAIHEAQGKPFTKEFGGKCTMLIARDNNPQYSDLLTEQYELHKEILDDKSSKEAKATAKVCSEKIMIFVMARAILLNWTGEVKYQKLDLPYSVENAEKLLGLAEFRKKVAELAADFRNFSAVTEAEDEKNLSPISDGASPGAVSSTS